VVWVQLESQPATGATLRTTTSNDAIDPVPVTAFAEPSDDQPEQPSEHTSEQASEPDESAPEPAAVTPPATHDIPAPSRLEQLMATGWAEPAELPVEVDPVAARAADRRRRLAALFSGDTLVVPSGQLKVRANDTDYPFRPDSDFVWLTGCAEPDAVLLVHPDGEGVLYLADRASRTTSAFYTDRRYGELWVGPRRGVRETAAALGLTCKPLDELDAALDRLAPATTRLLREIDPRIDAKVRPVGDAKREQALGVASSELRLYKDDFEISELQRAVDATGRGFEECVREMPAAYALDRGERWIEGTFWRRARLEGNDVGYGSIVATGPHATTLHWVRNDGRVQPGDLALLDMGIEVDSFYTADVTRTLPIDGRFRDVQRQVYDVVLAAQQAGIDATKPGADFLDPHRAAMSVIAHTLEDWGFLGVPAAESLQDNVGLHRRYTLHSTSHMLGLDVHDCANARAEFYGKGPLAEGMVLTVEPGLYFQADDLTIPPEFRGIGVRIEDDVVVTAEGCRVLSDGLPRTAQDVEEWVRELQR
jgi:Xaa-Pro aminopeptidase